MSKQGLFPDLRDLALLIIACAAILGYVTFGNRDEVWQEDREELEQKIQQYEQELEELRSAPLIPPVETA